MKCLLFNKLEGINYKYKQENIVKRAKILYKKIIQKSSNAVPYLLLINRTLLPQYLLIDINNSIFVEGANSHSVPFESLSNITKIGFAG